MGTAVEGVSRLPRRDEAEGSARTAASPSLDLTAARIRLRLEALEPIRFPVYKGSTFRGAFGTIFRRMCCIQPQLRDCGGCLLRMNCPFSLIFNPRAEGEDGYGRGMDEQPRPFVIEPPLQERCEYSVGEILQFNLLLFGRGRDYLPYFVLAFDNLGQAGLGKWRGRYDLAAVTSYNPYTGEELEVYTGKDQSLSQSRLDISRVLEPVPPDGGARTVAVEFITPTRLVDAGHLSGKPVFHAVFAVCYGGCRLSGVFIWARNWTWTTGAWPNVLAWSNWFGTGRASTIGSVTRPARAKGWRWADSSAGRSTRENWRNSCPSWNWAN